MPAPTTAISHCHCRQHSLITLQELCPHAAPCEGAITHRWCLQSSCSGRRDASLRSGVAYPGYSLMRTSALTCVPGRNWEAAPAVRVPSTAPATPKPLPGNCGRSLALFVCGEAADARGPFVEGGTAGVNGFSFTAGRLLSFGCGGGALVWGTVDVTSSSFSSASACAEQSGISWTLTLSVATPRQCIMLGLTL